MDNTNAKKRILEIAVLKTGSPAALAGRLGISEGVLKHYLSEAMVVPDEIYLRLVDIVQADRKA
ncbi:MAG: hypothetical protein QOD26_397 [Betaproteobacteria bacterium]|nr:hypothetical protein [Betaproteobacteria bacterium]